MVDRFAALMHHLFKVPVAQRVRSVPADADEDDLGWKTFSAVLTTLVDGLRWPRNLFDSHNISKDVRASIGQYRDSCLCPARPYRSRYHRLAHNPYASRLDR
jgi:hypothetical protein